MIFVDMDGVLADLYEYMSQRILRKPFRTLTEEQKEDMKGIFRDKNDFDEFFPEGPESMFERLRPYPFNKTLIETVVTFGGEYSILSRPSRLDLEGTKRAKIKWVQEHLSFCPPKDIILVQDKSSNGRAENNILIDDWDLFLDRWKIKGGHSIKYRAWDFDSAESVREYIEKKLRETVK